MQIMADVLDKPIKVAASEQACALGSAMAAATAAGLYPDMGAAQKAMGSGFETIYTPDAANAEKYRAIYERYKKICHFIEHEFTD
jgi:L-ribulokinase